MLQDSPLFMVCIRLSGLQWQQTNEVVGSLAIVAMCQMMNEAVAEVISGTVSQ